MDPMPIKKLPEYLESVRKNGEQDYIPVVEMGRIESKPSLFKILSLAAVLLLMVGVGTTAYSLSSRNITILINTDKSNVKAVSEMLESYGAEVISVKQENNVYEAKISLRKNKKSFLDNLRKIKEIDSVKLKISN
jgi:hypothetical protein